MHFQLAWRNIWRNPRRTTVIMIAIVIGVWTMIFTAALSRGMIIGMVNNAIATLTGEIQIHHKGYRNDPVIEHSMTHVHELEGALKKNLPPGSHHTSRIRVNAVASNARHSTGITLVGIDPVQETRVSFIGEKAIVQGRYLMSEDRNGIVVGQALADKFGTRVGRKLVLMSQDTDKEIASRAFQIIGIFKAEMEATEKQFVFVTLSSARKMLKLEKGISELSLILPKEADNRQIADQLRAALPGTYEVHTWQELLHAITAYLDIFDGFMFLWYLIIFIAMGFGIVNTMLMAVFERMREFGVLRALGMKPAWIIRGVLTESFLLLVMGLAIGDILSGLSVFALSGSGIDLSALAAGAEFAGISRIIHPVIQAKDLIMANVTVFVLGLLINIYPAAKAAKFTPVQAMAQT